MKSWAEKILLALAAIALASFVVLTLVGVMRQAAANMTPSPQLTSPIGPDISYCFHDDETRELWDCIRHHQEGGTHENPLRH